MPIRALRTAPLRRDRVPPAALQGHAPAFARRYRQPVDIATIQHFGGAMSQVRVHNFSISLDGLGPARA